MLLQGFNGNDSCHLLAVFDGHRGADTAEYASRWAHAGPPAAGLLCRASPVPHASHLPCCLATCTCPHPLPCVHRATLPLSAACCSTLLTPLPACCHRHLNSTLAACCGLYEAPSQALQAAFLELDAGFKQHWDKSRALRIAARTGEDLNPGCTALVALLASNSLYVACAGALAASAHHGIVPSVACSLLPCGEAPDELGEAGYVSQLQLPAVGLPYRC